MFRTRFSIKSAGCSLRDWSPYCPGDGGWGLTADSFRASRSGAEKRGIAESLLPAILLVLCPPPKACLQTREGNSGSHRLPGLEEPEEHKRISPSRSFVIPSEHGAHRYRLPHGSHGPQPPGNPSVIMLISQGPHT